MKIEVTATKSKIVNYLVSAKSNLFDETVILNSESDAEKTAQFTEKVFGGGYGEVEVLTGENAGNLVIVAVCDNKSAYVFESDDSHTLAADLMFFNIIATKIKSAAKVKQ